MTFGPYRMNDVDILDSGMVFIEGFYDSAPPEIIKAGWNWNLANNDGSLGVHNPSYAYLVVIAGIQALDQAAAESIKLPSWVQGRERLNSLD